MWDMMWDFYIINKRHDRTVDIKHIRLCHFVLCPLFYNISLLNLCSISVWFCFYVVFCMCNSALHFVLLFFLLFIFKKKAFNYTLKSTTCLSSVLSDRTLTSSLLSSQYLGQGRPCALVVQGLFSHICFFLFFYLAVGISVTQTRHSLEPLPWVILYYFGSHRETRATRSVSRHVQASSRGCKWLFIFI